jgi:hypothetical protein
MQNKKKSVAKAITGAVKSAPKDGYKQMKPNDIVKPGYGEMGRKLRPNYEKSEIKMASAGKTKMATKASTKKEVKPMKKK